MGPPAPDRGHPEPDSSAGKKIGYGSVVLERQWAPLRQTVGTVGFGPAVSRLAMCLVQDTAQGAFHSGLGPQTRQRSRPENGIRVHCLGEPDRDDCYRIIIYYHGR